MCMWIRAHGKTQNILGGLKKDEKQLKKKKKQKIGDLLKRSSENVKKLTMIGVATVSKKIHLTVNKLNRAQKDAIAEIIKEESKRVERRLQWIMFLAMADEFGIGKERFQRFLNRYFRYVDEYGAEKLIGAADDILTLRIRQRKWADIYEI